MVIIETVSGGLWRKEQCVGPNDAIKRTYEWECLWEWMSP